MTIQLLGKELETWVLNWKKIEEVWYWGKKVRPMGWQPWPNTLIYYPLKEDTNDYSGNWYHLINNGITFQSGYVKVDWNYQYAYLNNTQFEMKHGYTLSVWRNCENKTGQYDFWTIIDSRSDDSFGFMIGIQNGYLLFEQGIWWHSTVRLEMVVPRESGWHNAIVVCDGNNFTIIYDWRVINTRSANLSKWTSKWKVYAIWRRYSLNNSNILKGFLWEQIIEKKPRTIQKAQEYYASTKSAYWL